MSKILIIEDDNRINEMIATALKKEGYDTVSAFSGTEAMLRIESEIYDLLILDLMLPGLTGEEVINKVRVDKNMPILVLSAKDAIEVKIDVLKLGANDYMTKPFDINELIARVYVLLRDMNNRGTDGDSLVFKELELSDNEKSLKVGDKVIALTAQEFKIIKFFMKNPGRVFSKNEIYEYAWDDYFVGEDKTVNVHISNLRRKIKKYTDVEYIETLWGLGFRLKD